MSAPDIRKVVQEELNNIAPEVDLAAIDPCEDLREALDIDSMDFLNSSPPSTTASASISPSSTIRSLSRSMGRLRISRRTWNEVRSKASRSVQKIGNRAEST